MEENNISKKIREDLLIFKNDTLKDIKNSEKLLLEKFSNKEFSIIGKFENFENKFKKLNEKLLEISTFIESLKDIKNSVNSVLTYKTKLENSIIDVDIKLKLLDKDYHDSFYNISNILKNTVLYPKVIGPTAKFKTFHQLIDYILQHISYAKSFN